LQKLQVANEKIVCNSVKMELSLSKWNIRTWIFVCWNWSS